MTRRGTAWFAKRRELVAPTPLTASGVTSTALRVTGLPVTTATSYTFQRRVAGTSAWSTIYTGPSVSLTDTGLVSGGSYEYRHTFEVGDRTSPFSAATLVQTAQTPVPPPTPTDPPTAGVVSSASVEVFYPALERATAYTLQAAAASGGPFTTIYTGPDLEFTETGLSGGAARFYRYQGSNADGASGFSPVLSVTTAAAVNPPATPTTAPTVSGISSSTASIAWQEVATASAYLVQLSTTPGAGFSTIYSGPNLSVNKTGLTPSTRYYARYRPSNPAGTAADYSPEATFLTGSTANTGTVQPLSAKKLRSMSGAVIHAVPNPFILYEEVDAVMDAVERMGATWVRGLAVPGNALSDRYAAACKARGIGWCMGVLATSQSPTATKAAAKVRAIATHPDYSAVCIALEGLNEPNHQFIPPAEYGGDWAACAADIQRVISETKAKYPSLNGVERVGTSLHQLAAKNSGGQDYVRLKNAGILAHQDVAGIHCYPNGRRPMHNMDVRFALLRDAYGPKDGAPYPMRMTEFGYTTTDAVASGNTTTKKAMGIYGPRAYLQLCGQQGIPMSWYEVLDDVDSTGNTIQSHYGLVNTPQAARTTWTDKPPVTSIGALLRSMVDPAGTPDYTPRRVALSVSSGASDVDYVVTATKAQSDAGTASVWIFRDVDVATGVTNLNVLPVAVNVTDRAGARTIQVDGATQRIDTR